MPRLRAVLEEKEVTQKSLAKKAGVTASTMCKYVNGDREPGVRTAIRMARMLGVTVEELFGGDVDD